jgi:hypothetical protein
MSISSITMSAVIDPDIMQTKRTGRQRAIASVSWIRLLSNREPEIVNPLRKLCMSLVVHAARS